MRGTTIVFDLDGTLVDTAPDLVGATNHVLARCDIPPLPAARLTPWISFGARRMIVEAAAMSRLELSETEIDGQLEAFLDHYTQNIALTSRPFPGVERALDELAAAGARLAVCTNKREGMSRQLLDALDLTRRFAAIAGRDTFPVCKPDPGHLTGTIARAGGEIARAVMVGDSGVDVATARAAGVPVVGVTFGYTNIPVRDLAPDAVISSYGELGAALSRILSPASKSVALQP